MFNSINPYTNKQLNSYQFHNSKELENKFLNSNKAFNIWCKQGLPKRIQQIKAIGDLLIKYKQKAANAITQEMGKPIEQSVAEIEKCALLCNYYAENASSFLASKKGKTTQTSYVTYEPLGVILGIMPWNFPFWQVIRFAIPTVLAGNTVVLKHALNVPECALILEKIFNEAISVQHVYQNIFCDNETTENSIANQYVKGVSLTGSTRAGISVAQAAAKQLKHVVLELGGSNALIVFEDADLDKAAKQCLIARFMNNGQSCIAGKRLLIQESVKEQFLDILIEKVKQLKVGDPMDKSTYISVLAKKEFVSNLEKQLNQSMDQGAKLLIGGKFENNQFLPTIVSNVTQKMPLFNAEVFGPILAVTTFKTEDEAIQLSNATEFGLGVSLFSKNIEHMKTLVPKFEEGAVFINSLVKSMPQLPFGGVKMSGLGRELAEEGLKAFTNCKTVFIEN